jgi:hypothetical protein
MTARLPPGELRVENGASPVAKNQFSVNIYATFLIVGMWGFAMTTGQLLPPSLAASLISALSLGLWLSIWAVVSHF